MFAELAKQRRSIRKFNSQPVRQEQIDEIIEVALRSPSARATRPWEFVVVQDRQLLDKLSLTRGVGSEFFKSAPVGIVVCADPAKSRLWIEDCTIAAVSMQYAAHSMGLGSRWSQIRGNDFSETKTARDYLAELLGLPDHLDVECMIAIGHPDEKIEPYPRNELRFDKISYQRYGSKK
ncbi:MAG: nitroreductase family protein [Desulfobacterales bacterium]|nr:nitroreductase family protein [Desulfobacterales bacterium]